jgi:hypothetical protein
MNMKKAVFIMVCATVTILTNSSCGTSAGAGGTDSGVKVDVKGYSYNNYDLVPSGDRITYTIDISTSEGAQKLYKLTLSEAKRLAETEASRKYNCDRLIDPRFDYLMRGNRILRITVDGRPGFYKTQERQYDSRTRQEIDINVRQ